MLLPTNNACIENNYLLGQLFSKLQFFFVPEKSIDYIHMGQLEKAFIQNPFIHFLKSDFFPVHGLLGQLFEKRNIMEKIAIVSS